MNNTNTYLEKNAPANMINGSYYYAISFCSSNYESAISYIPDMYLVDGMESVNIFNIPISPDSNVTGRNIYRTQRNTTSYYLLDKLYDNTTTKYIDSMSYNNISNNMYYNIFFNRLYGL